MNLILIYLAGVCMCGLVCSISVRWDNHKPEDWDGVEWIMFSVYSLSSWPGLVAIIILCGIEDRYERGARPPEFMTRERPLFNGDSDE